MTPLARAFALAPALALALLPGCSSAPADAVIVVLPGEYPAAFDASREVLSEARFALERVDAAAGVITTQPKSTAGLASPWDTEQSTLAQEWEDLANQQRRVVRITFAPEGETGPTPPDQALPDRRTEAGPLVARVEVTLLRLRRPGWRIETESISRSTRSFDPIAAARDGGASFFEPVGQDDRLAGRLAQRIAQRLSQPPAPSEDAQESSPRSASAAP